MGHTQRHHKTQASNILRLVIVCSYEDEKGDCLQVVVLLNDKPITAYSFGSGMFKTT